MRVACVLVLLLLLYPGRAQQQQPLFVALAKGDSVLIFLTKTLPRDQAFWVLRRSPGARQWDTLTAEWVKGAENPVENREILGEEFPYVMEALDAKTELEVYRRLRGLDLAGDVLAMVSFRVAKALGRIFWDTAAGKGNRWEYRVIVVDRDSAEVESAAMVVHVRDRLPKVPENIELEQLSDTYVRLRWDYPLWQGDLQDLVYGFNVYRRQKGEQQFVRQNRLPILRLNNGFFQFDDRTVQPGKTYEYVVTSVDLAGRESSPSRKAKITVRDITPPSTPPAPTAVAIEGGARITWDVPPEPDAVGYNLYRSASLHGKRQKLNDTLIPLDQFLYVDTSDGVPLARYYGISVVDRAGNESEISTMTLVIAKDQTPPPVPTALSAEVKQEGVQVSWKAEPVGDLAGYYVFRRLVGVQHNMVKLNQDPIRDNHFFDAFDAGYFRPGAVVEYAVQAMDTVTNLSPLSDTLRFQIPDSVAPEPVRSVDYWISEDGSVILHWQPSVSIDADTVIVERQTPGTLQWRLAAAETMIRDTAVQPGRYRYQLQVQDRSGNRSEPVAVTVEVPDNQPPAPPRNVRVRKEAETIMLEWDPVADPDLAGYTIYASEFPTGVFQPIAERIPDARFSVPKKYHGWYLKVSAVDRSGNESATSAAVLAE